MMGLTEFIFYGTGLLTVIGLIHLFILKQKIKNKKR